MSCCGSAPDFTEVDDVSRLVSARIAGFLRTLRDAGFRVGKRVGVRISDVRVDADQVGKRRGRGA